MKSFLRVIPILVLALVFAVPVAHAQSCLDTGCSLGEICKGSPPTCQPNPADTQFGPSASGSGFPTPNPSELQHYADAIINFINDYLVPVIIAIAFIVFLWGVYNYFIYGAADEEKRKTGRQFVMYGLIGFVLIFALWGVVNLIGDAFNLTGGGPPPTPKL